jgi:predicted dehydrogenase/threonine dehydrogenase-like Zn-dependent dehydrogenase
MKQVFIQKGNAILENVPSPEISEKEILVKVYYSCISVGTEITNVKASGKPIYKKALDKPKNLQKIFENIKNSGFKKTITKVQNKIDAKNPIGYSASGIVLEVGSKIKEIKKGDKVACAGVGIANHAEFIAVPENLTVKVPDSLSLKYAATTTLGSIAMQGIRRADVKLGDRVVVIGLGILGQLSTQMLKNCGCHVIGIDLSQDRVDKAVSLGLENGLNASKEDVMGEVIRNTDGYGADCVIITATSQNSKVTNQAIEMCRKKGRVVIVGVVGLDLKREEFYRKELDVLISTSYGPGRYDERYEKEGCDYPYAYVRWTENRNMREYLNLLAKNKVKIDPLIDRVYKLEDAGKAYDELKSGDKKPLIVLFEYNKDSKPNRKIVENNYKIIGSKINVGVIGAGGFAKGMHLPNLNKLNNVFNIYAVCSKTGSNAKAVAEQYNSAYSTTDYRKLLEDSKTEMVIISTRHNLHAKMTIDAINAGKAVLLEKPMALNKEEMDKLVGAVEKNKVPFIVGFNRRFSPYAVKIKQVTANRANPMIINYRMNAGFIPKEHWVHTEEGGGRNIGEACHIYDLFNYFIDSEVSSIKANNITPKTEQYNSNDNFSVIIKYKDGSLCNLIYTALGNDIVPKEQMEIFVDNKIIQLVDYKRLNFYGINERTIKSSTQSKGQYEELLEFGKSIKNGSESPIPLWQLIQATEISFEVERQFSL